MIKIAVAGIVFGVKTWLGFELDSNFISTLGDFLTTAIVLWAGKDLRMTTDEAKQFENAKDKGIID